jgi:virginiamycin B lyase
MRINRRVVFFGVICAAVAGGASAATVAGAVISNGKAMTGAMITLTSADGMYSETVLSDASGRYRLTTAQHGALKLRARAALSADDTVEVELPSSDAQVAHNFSLRALTSPQEISDSLPASAHIAKVKFPTEVQREVFQLDCVECHQTGAPATRRPRSLQEWEALMPSMLHGAEYTSNLHAKDYAAAMHAAFNGSPTQNHEETRVDADALNSRITEWKLPHALAAHDTEYYAPTATFFSVDMYIDDLYATDTKTNTTTDIPIPAFGIPIGGTFAGQKDLPLYVKNIRHGLHSLVLGSDGLYYMTGAIGGDIVVFDPAKQKFLAAYPVWHGAEVGHTPRFDANGMLWFTLYASNQVGRFDPKTKHMTVIDLPNNWAHKEIVERPAAVYGIDINPLDGSVWYTKLYANQIGRIDAKTLQVQEWTPPVFGPRRARFDNAGGFWIPGFGDGKIARLDTKTMKYTIFKIPTLGPDEVEAPYAVAIEPKTQDVWVSTNISDRMFRYEPKTQRWTAYPMPTRGLVTRDVVFTPDGRVCGASNPWGVPFPGLVEGNLDSVICLQPDIRKASF